VDAATVGRGRSERIEPLDRYPTAALDGIEERADVGAPAGDEHARHLAGAAGRQVEVQRALDLAGQLLDDPRDDLRDLAGNEPPTIAAALVGLGLVGADPELALDLFGDLVAAVGDVAREGRGAGG